MCLARSASGRPILALQLLPQTGPWPGPAGGDAAGAGGTPGSSCRDAHCGGVSGSPASRDDAGIWVAATDLAGTATVLLDRPAASGAPNQGCATAGQAGGSAPGPACCWQWQPYGGGPGPVHVGIWWGTHSSDSSGCGGDGEAGSLGCRVCFTCSGEGHLTAWQLPPGPGSGGSVTQCPEQQHDRQQHCQPPAGREQDAEQQPVRLAEALLPFGSPATCLAAAALPRRLLDGRPAAVVAAGDSHGGVTVLLLLLPPAAPAGEEPSEPGAGLATCGRPAGRLLVLAAARRVHELTPVRLVQVAPLRGAAARAGAADDAGAELARSLAEAEVLTAGGDNIVRAMRLPWEAIQAAVAAGLAPAAASSEAATVVDGVLPSGGGSACASGGAAQRPPPRLLGVRQRHFEAVTHIDGVVRGHGPGGEPGSRSAVGSGPLVFGHFSTHFSVWDAAAEAEVARVRCARMARAPGLCLASTVSFAFAVPQNGASVCPAGSALRQSTRVAGCAPAGPFWWLAAAMRG